MRGRTLNDAFIILDEAQNTTPQQMKMFLTRFGMRSRMVICGDPNQTDLPPGVTSGLADAVVQAGRHPKLIDGPLHAPPTSSAIRWSAGSSRPMRDRTSNDARYRHRRRRGVGQ